MNSNFKEGFHHRYSNDSMYIIMYCGNTRNCNPVLTLLTPNCKSKCIQVSRLMLIRHLVTYIIIINNQKHRPRGIHSNWGFNKIKNSKWVLFRNISTYLSIAVSRYIPIKSQNHLLLIILRQLVDTYNNYIIQLFIDFMTTMTAFRL